MSRAPTEASSSATTAGNSGVSDSDIVHLLWFLNKVLRIHDSTPFIPSTRRGFDDSVLRQSVNSPLPNTPEAADRLRVLLDAICAVTVEGRNQVLAMTLACNDRETRLCVAQNSTQLPPSTSDFLVELWTCLQELSKIQMTDQSQASNQPDPYVDSPPVRTQNPKLSPHVRRIHSMVYRHCYRRFHRRVTKREGQLELFCDYFRRARDREDPLEGELNGVLHQAMTVREFTIKYPQVPEDIQLNALVTEVRVLNRRLTAFLGGHSAGLTKDSVATLELKLLRSHSFKSWLKDEKGKTIRTFHPCLAE
jgi:hypothetical protein